MNRTGEDWGEGFLAAYAASGNISYSCAAVGISRETFYLRRNANETFRKAAKQAKKESTEALELEARRRAYHGVDEPIVYEGQLSGTWVDKDGRPVPADQKIPDGSRFVPLTIKKYSDTMLMFLLNGLKPKMYKHRHEHSGEIGSKGEIVVKVLGPGMSMADLNKPKV